MFHVDPPRVERSVSPKEPIHITYSRYEPDGYMVPLVESYVVRWGENGGPPTMLEVHKVLRWAMGLS